MNVLNENPDSLGSVNGVDWSSSGSYAFGWYNNKVKISNEKGNHGTLASNIKPNDKHPIIKVFGNFEERRYFDYPGRIWLNQKVISFWIYPKSNKQLKRYITELEHGFRKMCGINVDIWNDLDFTIEITADDENVEEFGDGVKGEWENTPVHKYISLKDFKRSRDATKKELNTPHIPPDSTIGWGSDHPKYQNTQRKNRYIYTSEEFDNYKL